MSDMKKIERTLTIKAPVEKVFSFVANPANLAEIWPNLIDISNVKELTRGGFSYKWTYMMSGIRFEGETETLEFLTNRRIVTKSTRGLENVIAWNFEPNNEETHLSLDIEYRIPSSLLVRLSEAILAQENEHIVDAMLENVKDRVEFVIPYPAKT